MTVVNLVTEDSVEARMVETLSRKRTLADGVLDGEGGLDRLEIGSGRQAFFQRLESVVREPPSKSLVPHASLEALHAVDAELGFAAVVSERLGDGLLSCEVRQTSRGHPVVLLVVAEGEAASATSVAKRVSAKWFAGEEHDIPAIEVVARTTYDVLRRLVSHGALLEPDGAVRVLYVRGRGLAQPKLAPDDGTSRVFALRRRAAMAFRRARQLVTRLSFDAAREPLEESVMLLACAYAVQHGLAEPQDVKQAIAETFAGVWGDTRPVLVQLLDSEGSPVSVVRALTTKFGTS